MLVLTRKVGEEVRIGDDVRVTVVSIVGGKCRLGITAPPEVHVDRQEVRIAKEETAIGTPWCKWCHSYHPSTTPHSNVPFGHEYVEAYRFMQAPRADLTYRKSGEPASVRAPGG